MCQPSDKLVSLVQGGQNVFTWLKKSHRYFRIPNTSSVVAEMGDRLATTDMGRKVEGAAVPLSVGGLGPHLAQCRLGRGLPPTSASIDTSPLSARHVSIAYNSFGVLGALDAESAATLVHAFV